MVFSFAALAIFSFPVDTAAQTLSDSEQVTPACIMLGGKIVTMTPAFDIIEHGYVWIENGVIEMIIPNPVEPPTYCGNVIETSGIIFPGLIDSHNHPSWNMLPLWNVPEPYGDRYVWQKNLDYIQSVRNPHTILVDPKYDDLMIEAMKYSEVKALVGGTTALQGTWTENYSGYTDILVHIIENEHPGGINIRDHVQKIYPTNSSVLKDLIEDLDSGKTNVFIQHLGEGRDEEAISEFQALKDDGLLREEVIVIHGTAFDANDFAQMSEKGTKLVWSPLSNLLLYGVTMKIEDAWDENVLVSFAPDRSPSGSKNVLQELKVGYWWNHEKLNDKLSPYNFTQMVTTHPAEAIKWEDYVGTIVEGSYADLMVINDVCAEPEFKEFCKDYTNDYMSLMLAGDEDVLLVIVKGDPLYGKVEFMDQLKENDYEIVNCNGWKRALDVTNPIIPKGDQK